MLSVGFVSRLIIPQKCWFSSGTMTSFPCTDKRGADTPLLSQIEAPGNITLAGLTFANLSGHLTINLKILMTDSLNTPGCPARALLPPPTSFSLLFGLCLYYFVSMYLLSLQAWVTVLASLPPSGKNDKLPVGVLLTTAPAYLLNRLKWC